MDTNLHDINRNLEKENVGSSANSTSMTKDIKLESATSEEGFGDDTPNNIQESTTVNESIPAEPIDKTNDHITEDAK